MTQHTDVPVAVMKTKMTFSEPFSKPRAVRRRNHPISRPVDEQSRCPNRLELKAPRAHTRKVIVNERSGASSRSLHKFEDAAIGWAIDELTPEWTSRPTLGDLARLLSTQPGGWSTGPALV